MKKLLTCMWLLLSVFTVTACGSESQASVDPDTGNGVLDGEPGKTLIVYFS